MQVVLRVPKSKVRVCMFLSPSLRSLTRSRVQITLARPQGAPERLQGNSLDSSLVHAEGNIMQTRQSLGDITTRSGPEDLEPQSSGGETLDNCENTNLSTRGRTRPDDVVQVVGAGLFSPEEMLTLSFRI